MTELYINIGYTSATKIAVISGDALLDVVTLHPKTEFSDIITIVTVLCKRFEIHPDRIRTRDYNIIATLLQDVKRNLGVVDGR